MKLFRVLLLAGLAGYGVSVQAAPPVMVQALDFQPVVDGGVEEWNNHPNLTWQSLETKSSLMDEDGEEDPRLESWQPELQVLAGVHGEKFYLAARWRDDSANTVYKPWKRQGSRYNRSNRKDDMFAVRFELRGDFNACMLSNREYEVDLWLWSAGRSNLVGYADDMLHRYSTRSLDPAIEVPTRYGVVYIQKVLDEGESGWAYLRAPQQIREEVVPSVGVQVKPAGSRADVAAVGQWRDGWWVLEMSRALRTGDTNDVILADKSQITGQIAVFNAEYQLAKKITHKLNFDFGLIR